MATIVLGSKMETPRVIKAPFDGLNEVEQRHGRKVSLDRVSTSRARRRYNPPCLRERSHHVRQILSGDAQRLGQIGTCRLIVSRYGDELKRLEREVGLLGEFESHTASREQLLIS